MFSAISKNLKCLKKRLFIYLFCTITKKITLVNSAKMPYQAQLVVPISLHTHLFHLFSG